MVDFDGIQHLFLVLKTTIQGFMSGHVQDYNLAASTDFLKSCFVSPKMTDCWLQLEAEMTDSLI